MLGYALRRILWSIPTLLATSLVLFFVTTLAPDAGSPATLPRFLNTDLQDVRSRARVALEQAASDGPSHEIGVRELRRLGGAALPHVLPLLEALPPDGRRRVAAALAPVAERMGVAEPGELAQPEAAALFWARFWDDRAIDFTRPAVQRAVLRLVEHGSDMRERDLVALDTFALPEVVGAMATTTDGVALARLTRLAHRAAERGPVLAPDAPAADRRRALADWQEWWFVQQSDFVTLEGATRAIAVVTETRYGKWLRRATSGRLGVSAIDGEPVADKLARRAPLTLLLCALAMVVSWGLAIPIGAFGAWRRGRTFDVTSSAVIFVLYATPTFAVAELLRRAAGSQPTLTSRFTLAVIALAAGSLATSSRWQRAAMLDVVREDFVRTAHAKGVPGWRVAVVHALRNAWMPTVTLAGLHLPALLGGALVVEEVFGLPGAGFETLRAVESHDTAWLMAIILAAAALVTMGLVASDIAYGALDPRVREVLVRRQGGRAP